MQQSPHLSDPNDAQSFEETVQLINHLNTLSSLLLSRRFPQFWTLLRSSEPTSAALQPYISEYPDFDALVHRSVGKAVGLTFSRISKLRLRIWLGLEESEKGEKELVDWVEEMGWTVEGDVVSLPKQKELVIKPAAGQTKESISIEREFPEVFDRLDPNRPDLRLVGRIRPVTSYQGIRTIRPIAVIVRSGALSG